MEHTFHCLGLLPFTLLIFINMKILQKICSNSRGSFEGTGDTAGIIRYCSDSYIVVHVVVGEVEGGRISQQSRDVKLAIILVCMECIFFFCHAPR